MGKPTLEWYDSNFEPLNTADFLVMFSDYPELGPMVAEMEVPTRSIGRVRLEFRGKSRVFPGRRISSSNEVTLTILLDRRSQTYQKLIAIQDSFSDPDSGNIVGRPFTVRSIMYDGAGNEAIVFNFTECWLAEVGAFQLGGGTEGQIAQVQCTLCYARAGYQFTGISNENVYTPVMSRISETPVLVGSTDKYGSVPALSISKTLAGGEPLEKVSSIRQSLASFVGFTIDDLQNMQNVISAVRSALNGVDSKTVALRDYVKQRTIQGAISALSGIKSYF